MVPDLRPSSPLSTGPTLFLASSPTEWHGRHFLNDCSPAATSWANAPPVEAASTAAISINVLVMMAPLNGYREENPTDERQHAAPRQFGWPAPQKLSTGNRTSTFR